MRVAVIGAGLMGHGIALVWAIGGHTVRLHDNNPDTLARAKGLMAKALATLEEAGEARGFGTAQLAQHVTRHDTLEQAVEGAELVIEAIVENPEAKRVLFAQLAEHAPATATIASNTSYLDVFPLAPASLATRLLIAHWYTPPYLVDLVDLVPGPECEEVRLVAVRDAILAMGQVPVVMRRFIPGYIANRIQAAIQNEVQHLIDAGYADAQMVDAAVVHGIALRMPILGVMAKADFTGLPLLQHSFRNRMYAPPMPFDSSPSMDALIEQGATGVMGGRGYYEWGNDPAALFEDRDRRLIALKKALREIGTLAGFRA